MQRTGVKSAKDLYNPSNLVNTQSQSESKVKLRIAEVGVEKGETFRYMMQKLSGYIEHYAVIDPYRMEGKESLDDVLEYYHQNVTEHCEKLYNSEFQSPGAESSNNPKCTVHRSPSLAIQPSTHYPHNYFDLIFIDAEHSYEAIRNDLSHYYPLLNSDSTSIIAGHDFSAKDHIAVVLGVMSFFGELGEREDRRVDVNLGMETVWWVERG